MEERKSILLVKFKTCNWEKFVHVAPFQVIKTYNETSCYFVVVLVNFESAVCRLSPVACHQLSVSGAYINSRF